MSEFEIKCPSCGIVVLPRDTERKNKYECKMKCSGCSADLTIITRIIMGKKYVRIEVDGGFNMGKGVCGYCGKPEHTNGVRLCDLCNTIWLDGEREGIEHAQYIMRTALGLEKIEKVEGG